MPAILVINLQIDHLLLRGRVEVAFGMFGSLGWNAIAFVWGLNRVRAEAQHAGLMMPMSAGMFRALISADLRLLRPTPAFSSRRNLPNVLADARPLSAAAGESSGADLVIGTVISALALLVAIWLFDRRLLRRA